MILCKVDRVDTNVPSFYCRMGRYVFSVDQGKFIPGRIEVGTTIAELLSKSSGLTSEQAVANFQLVGPNIIPVEKPTVIGSIFKEFSKTFYIYQNFMVWTWFPYWFYYMALVNTSVRVTGGLIVASFQHVSDCVLYKLSNVEGQVE